MNAGHSAISILRRRAPRPWRHGDMKPETVMGRAGRRPGPLRWRALFLAVALLPTAALGEQTSREKLNEQLDHRLWKDVGGCPGAMRYLEALPEGLHAGEAQECLDWAEVQGCEDAGAVERFLAAYPEGRHVAEARECLAWLDVRSCEDIERVKEFQSRFPAGRYTTAAAACVAKLGERRAAERHLALCRAHRDAGRLTRPTGGNALACYQKVLHDPDLLTDAQMWEAEKGIKGIEAHYIDKARTALERERPGAAERAIERLKEIHPESQEVEMLEAGLADLARVLAERASRNEALEALVDEVEALLSKRDYAQARAELEAGRKAGLSGKRIAALEERIDRDALVAEVRTLLGAGDVAGARARLAQARKGLLSGEARSELEAAIKEEETAGRDALVADVMARLEQSEYGAAREALERARALGLPEARYEALSERIGRSEREARASALLPTCREHLDEAQFAQAQTCYREVLALEPEHADAKGMVPGLEVPVAWEAARTRNTVEGYLEFERDHPDSMFFGQSQCERMKLQGAEC